MSCGGAGGLGSVSVMSAAGDEIQLFNSTVMLLYVPASNAGMIKTPEAFV